MSTTAGTGARAGKLPPSIGRYRVVERIGTGAMGMVYAAEDDTLGRRVAVKVMMGDLEDEPEMRGRFFREAKITGQLAHRNIVTVFDLGEEDHRPYIVMELLTGMALPEYLAMGAAASLDAKLDLMMQVCEGLQAAHSKGVVHRDVKPSNLFVQKDGSVKILDFGVARLASSNLTKHGFLVGTPEFMSPEQARGEAVDARSDVFSAAGVFYFMLAGHGPFSSQDLPQMLRAVIHDHPPPLTDAQAPDGLRRALMKALAKAPNERHQQCADLQADLARVRRSQGGVAHRYAQAALDRYRQVAATIEERAALGKAVGRADIERSAASALARLAARFPEFAKHTDPHALMDPMDSAVAQEALSSLQTRHNAEIASLEALRMEASNARKQAASIEQADLTLHRTPMPAAPSAESEPQSSLKDRAAALWRKLGGT